MKGKSKRKLWHRLDVEISTWIWLSKSTKYRSVFHVDFSALNRHNWCACCFQSLVSSHFLNWDPILSKFGVVLSRCNFKDIDVVTDTGTIRTIFLGNFATTQINMNKDHFYLLQNNTNKDYNANICTMKKYIYIFFTNKCF